MAFEVPFPLGTLFQKLDSGLVRGEALFYPEFSRLEGNRERVQESIDANLHAFLTKLPHGSLGRRRMAAEAKILPIELKLKPPKPTSAWRDEIGLKFTGVVWQHDASTWVGRVIELGIEVIVGKETELEGALKRDIISALRRDGYAAELHKLAHLQRTVAVRLDWTKLTVRFSTLKQMAMEAESLRESEKPKVLKQVARYLHSKIPPSFEVEETVQRIADALTDARPQSVLLVGPGGVGKTAAVRELVRQKSTLGLGETPFYQTSGSALVAGMCGFGMWQERCRDLCREASRAEAVLHLGNLVELMEVGKSEHNQIGIAGFLRPSIARGEIVAIAECTPEQHALIERESLQLIDAFRVIRVEEPDRIRTRSILTQFVGHAPLPLQRPLGPTVIDTVERLHRRYATYSASPGRPLRFLQNMLEDAPPEHYLLEADVLTAFSRESGLPRVLIDPQVSLNLEETHRWFATRVVGQTEAVSLVVDLLATIKAGLTRPDRPIASLLFIGPTGVGKTEMAKALAEFLFGSRDRLTRFDMSEFADPISVQRLVGGVHGTEGLLTSKIREQPFSVVLLDEFEKAHPAFFDLMLQVLGEARLTDAGGRLADFRNAVVIITSNLGAETYQQGGFGFSGQKQPHERFDEQQARHAKEHFVREVEAFLRPEMFNRLDRLVPFAPLKFDIIRAIAGREWQKLLARDGLRYRSVSVAAAAEVLPLLAEKGFDVRYGARPLKRAMEREVLAPLAHRMNHYPGDAALNVNLSVASTDLEVEVKPRLDEAGRTVSASQVESPLGDLIRKASDLRRWFQSLENSSRVREMQNDIFQYARIEKDALRRQRKKPDSKLRPDEVTAMAELSRLRDLYSCVTRIKNDLFDVEESALTHFHALDASTNADGSDERFRRDLGEQLDFLDREWNALLLRLYGFRAPETAKVTVALFSEDRDALYDLAGAYAEVAKRNGGELELLWSFRLPGNVKKHVEEETEDERKTEEEPPPPRRWLKNQLIERDDHGNEKVVLLRELTDDREKLLKSLDARSLGLLMRLAGEASYVRFVDEAGLHVIRHQRDGSSLASKILVETSDVSATKYLPPAGVSRRQSFAETPKRRVYDRTRERIEDTRLNKTFAWTDKDLSSPLHELLNLRMQAILRQMVLE